MIDASRICAARDVGLLPASNAGVRPFRAGGKNFNDMSRKLLASTDSFEETGDA
jgi:hypothetical protein